MLEKISFKYKGKTFRIKAKRCNEFEKAIGLMFKSRGTKPLLFDFKKPTNLKIHSFFVFFPFVAVWIDGRGKVIEAREIRPFTLAAYPKKSFKRLIEVPGTMKDFMKMRFFVGD